MQGHDLPSAPLPSKAVRDVKRWVIALPPRGELHLDAGATKAVRRGLANVFAAGLKPDGVIVSDGIDGFDQGDAVRLMDEAGVEFGRGVINYSSAQARKLCGCCSEEVAELLGNDGPQELVSRQNIAVTAPLPPEA